MWLVKSILQFLGITLIALGIVGVSVSVGFKEVIAVLNIAIVFIWICVYNYKTKNKFW